MRPIHTYLEHQERKLLLDYEGIRKTHKDPDVKGTVNEGIVAEFLTKHMAGRGIAKNSEIIDSYGDRSDECDVCVCNEDQPFHATSGDVLIAEGVDCVIQVKGCLTGTEIDRTIKNCRSVKQLRRRAREGELTHTHKDDIKYHLERIPYFVLALSSRVSLETATLRYWKGCVGVPFEHQPDGVFILNKGMIYNCREGKGKSWRDGEGALVGFACAYTEGETLLRFVQYVTTIPPRVRRLVSPLDHYLASPTSPYRVRGVKKP